MAKRIKKPLVEPGKRREWFRRYEEDGQSAQQIAKADYYDVRTVRRQIDLERQERERKEARSTVLRKALEEHYADLCTFAHNLESALDGGGNRLTMLKGERMWLSLREHLPRSTMWKNLDKLEQLRAEMSRLDKEMNKLVGEKIESEAKAKFGKSAQEAGLTWSIVGAVWEQMMLAARGQPQLLDSFDFERIPKTAESGAKELVAGILGEAASWREYESISRIWAELKQVRRTLNEELAIITLRRVVPGKCKYCPV